MTKAARRCRRPQEGEVHMGGQVAAPWFAEKVSSGPMPLVGEGGAGHPASGVTQGDPLTTVIEHEDDPLGEFTTQPAGPFGRGWRDLSQLPLRERWPADHKGGEPIDGPWIGRPFSPGKGICYRVSGNTALGEAARGGGATDHDVEGEGVGELIGDDDPCSGWAPRRNEGWPPAWERR
jgi:hypothetical protein